MKTGTKNITKHRNPKETLGEQRTKTPNAHSLHKGASLGILEAFTSAWNIWRCNAMGCNGTRREATSFEHSMRPNGTHHNQSFMCRNSDRAETDIACHEREREIRGQCRGWQRPSTTSHSRISRHIRFRKHTATCRDGLQHFCKKQHSEPLAQVERNVRSQRGLQM